MFRIAFAAVLAALFCMPVAAEDKPEKKPTVDLHGEIKDRDLQKAQPTSWVIVSQKSWEKLAKAWDIKDPPKVDFDKELLIVWATVGSKLSLSSTVDDKGDLKITAVSSADLSPGFRYAIKSVSRDGVKTVGGKNLPKE